MKRRSCLAAVVLLVLVLAIGVLGIRWGGEALGRALHPKEYSEYVEYYADKYQIDPLLLYSFICTESGFDPKAQSSVDARGLMQITDETFQWIKSKIAPTEALTFEDLYDPEVNVRFGSYYLAVILERYDQDISTAAAAYHSGWGTVDQLLEQEKYTEDGRTLIVFPYEQMDLYVKKIHRNYDIYQRLYGASAE